MKSILKASVFILFLTSCLAHTPPSVAEPVAVVSTVSLIDQVQELVARRQEKAISALPSDIAGFVSIEPVADREKNQKGAGFTRVYTFEDVVATVFVYNNQMFGVTEEILPQDELLMDKHLSEMQAMEASGLYSQVKAGTKKIREFKARGKQYKVLEAEVSFMQKEEPKISFFALGTDVNLMSYVRIRFTYPRQMRFKIASRKNNFVRDVLLDLNAFATSPENMQ